MSEQAKAITSPLPGVFYRRPSPDKPPFVEEGQSVRTGDVVGLVEVMKNFYEITAEESGVVLRFLVEDASLIDAGQAVAELKGEE
jgi:acetyl-CoA carboxylase biotin carboxyl carrier protein